MPTLEEIARISKVSRSTVSRVINNDPHVKASTRERVMQVVRELNYEPHAVARSLASGRTRILGLMVPAGIAHTFEDPFFPIFARGVATSCNALDYSVMLWLADRDYERRMISEIVSNGMLAGVIMSTIHMPTEMLHVLRNSGLPFVLIGRNADYSDVSYVDVENRKGATESVLYLLRNGYSRIANITGPLDTITAQDRRDGYLDALRDRRRKVLPELMVEGDFQEASGYYGALELLEQEPDAFVCGNDLMAIGALRAIRERGLRVPDDIAVVGFDDVPSASLTSPALTTVRQPSRHLGIVATEILVDMIEHDDTAPHRVVLPTELVIRESCGTVMRRKQLTDQYMC